jgi:hypothetical protein
MTEKDAAKALIRVSVYRGASIESLADGMQGTYCSTYAAHIGGYLWSGERCIQLKRFEIGVSRVEGRDCLAVFSLREIYNELLYEKEHGEIRQESLF